MWGRNRHLLCGESVSPSSCPLVDVCPARGLWFLGLGLGSFSGCIVAALHWFSGCGSARCVGGRLLIGELYNAISPGVLAAVLFFTLDC